LNAIFGGERLRFGSNIGEFVFEHVVGSDGRLRLTEFVLQHDDFLVDRGC